MLEPKVHMYTYNIQYVNFRWDVKKEMGQIDAAGAINAFRSFPFREQQKKAQNLSAPTAPTISFVSRMENNNLRKVLETDGVFFVSTSAAAGNRQKRRSRNNRPAE